ncbi:bifunctional proline dehydrogenase/L-glutamate gamma-semialdehyde dehydrogenase [Novipirellula artificiosorum]|uniref:L-glutamate gamma-semialdehyde dehydrogenase n=1 Tax=Novipirellula artificiosorum TaxID=2528016 RepID=A0A5C6E0E6_9BACT|nr:bifunctional proline dehydrogenase/L-glutamate gamma-semialdehyde dehydrogenase [Novipirellula artificiosorum]TWU42195.1 Bifunctional protein PutA [Novipirellula artificiosorum]
MNRSWQNGSLADRTIAMAAKLLEKAIQLQTPQERRQQSEFDRMVSNPEDKATLVEMTDQAFRTHSPARVADQLTHLLDVQGIPRFFSPIEQAMLRGFQSFGEYLPGVAVPMVKEKMRRETANVILPAEPDLLAEHLQARQSHGVQMNVNLLGEAILGEAEARRRIEQCYKALRMPELECLSIKISTLYSQISPLARDHSIAKVSDRLESLYRIAMSESDPEAGIEKFVYLDMEEYRDLYLTADILCDTLDREGMDSVHAGIALQAYIPDSLGVLQRLIAWSKTRVASGSQPITIRLVKGANLEMERVDASIRGIPSATYCVKHETDANFKRMLRLLIDAASAGSLRVGVASHNLFDVALALIWADEQNAMANVQFEMLEGMANHQRRAISAEDIDMVLYAPACFRDGFLNAIGYLIRRLDENTGPENFLRHTYRLTPDSDDFRMLSDGFRKSLEAMETVSGEPRRAGLVRGVGQDVSSKNLLGGNPKAELERFVNEPDTDWSLPGNAEWIEAVMKTKKGQCVDLPQTNISKQADVATCFDPSQPDVPVCRYVPATIPEVHAAVDRAVNDESDWANTTIEHRHALLQQTAQNLRDRRGELIAVMVADGGKTVSEADPEVSEAIDFCEFYPLSVNIWRNHPTIRLRPRGVVAVVSPWNFPLAIPCGGIAASLAAGNRVILKPASQTVLTAWELCRAFWDAGVPESVLQCVPCSGQTAEAGLIKNPSIDTVILTGGTTTAKRMLTARPDLHLLAETGGKNATIVTAMADRELAVKHVVQSAFGHSGQKCSATSLLLLEDEVFHDKRFRDLLADAVESIRVGSSWDLSTRMGPLITKPRAELNRGLKSLEEDESWLVVPEHVVANPNLYRPGVKWNIRPGSFTHLTELFGPVLGVMRFSRLEEAIAIIRSTGYGLTSGIESLDEREIELWRETIHAGNLYINRPTTGAIVLRQPFGGVGLSAYGPGVKAGGPHYVLALMNVENRSETHPSNLPTASNPFCQWLDHSEAVDLLDAESLVAIRMACQSQLLANEQEFAQQHDTFKLVGQDNLRRYRSTDAMNLRFDANDSLRDALISVSAAIAVNTQLTLSLDPTVAAEVTSTFNSVADVFPGLIHPVEETQTELALRMADGNVGRLRRLGSSTSPEIDKASAEDFVTVVREPVVIDGRIECLRYLDEQSISHDYHRYGNLGRRSID